MMVEESRMTAGEFIALKPKLCAACTHFQDGTCKWLDREEYEHALTNADGHHIVSCPWNHQSVQPQYASVDPPAMSSRTGNAITRITTMAGEFLTAVTGPRVDETTFHHRLEICRACPQRSENAGHEYCGACGCPKWLPAELRLKARLANANCPLGKWPNGGTDS